MRKTVLILLLALLIPAAAQSQSRAPQNGTLSIREGRGIVQVDARGSMTGRVNGKITITDTKPYDSKRPVVYGAAKTTYRNVKTTVYQGKDIHFRIAGYGWRVAIAGSGIDASVSGRGAVVLRGIGTYSQDGSEPAPWPTDDEPISVGG